MSLPQPTRLKHLPSDAAVTASLFAYRLAAPVLRLYAKRTLARRIKEGKEDPARLPERFGTASRARPAGRLIWMHAASVGETMVHLQLMRALRADPSGQNVAVVLTTQTLTSAKIAADKLTGQDTHQMAPLDTPDVIARFLDHWRPDAFVLAESEIWPNMLLALAQRGVPRLLVNARMRDRSLRNWQTRRAAFRALLGGFHFIGAADQRTANGLTTLLGRAPDVVGNLKLDQPAPQMSAYLLQDVAALRLTAFLDRPVLLAASTHPGEEALLLESCQALQAQHKGLALILAPRHPERGQALADWLTSQNIAFARRSLGQRPTPETSVYLADTIGEMSAWFALADAVYLGGGHAKGVGGHNPIEAVRLGLPVISGPLAENFEDVFTDFIALGVAELCPEADLTKALAATLRTGRHPLSSALQTYLSAARAPAQASLSALLAVLPNA